MMETLYGSTDTLWTPIEASGFAFPPVAPVTSAILQGSLFAPSPTSGVVGQGQPHASVLPAPGAPPGQTYGYPVAQAPIPGEPALGGAIPFLLGTVAIRRCQSRLPSTDQEIEDFVYDAFELIPGAAVVEVRCEAGKATLTGNVQNKRLKRDLGEILWAIPSVNDVQNNVTIVSRRRARTANRESESLPAAPVRKPA
jgi:hypothetical protein